MKFQPGPPPKIESTCQVVEPPPPSPTPITFDIYSSAITVAPGVINRIAGSGWDAMARSNREFNIGDSITVTFNCPDTNGYNMVGFARSNFDDSCTGCYALMPYSVTCSRNSEIHGYELGEQKPSNTASFTTYTASSVLELRLNSDGTVQYAKDGTVFHTSAVTNEQWPLYVGAVSHDAGSPTISNLKYMAPDQS